MIVFQQIIILFRFLFPSSFVVICLDLVDDFTLNGLKPVAAPTLNSWSTPELAYTLRKSLHRLLHRLLQYNSPLLFFIICFRLCPVCQWLCARFWMSQISAIGSSSTDPPFRRSLTVGLPVDRRCRILERIIRRKAQTHRQILIPPPLNRPPPVRPSLHLSYCQIDVHKREVGVGERGSDGVSTILVDQKSPIWRRGV